MPKPIGSITGEQGLLAKLERRFFAAQGDGLHQFKASFAPQWQRLYVAGPSWLALALGGAELAREILRPRPNMKPMPRCDAEYEFASAPAPWQREGELAS